MTVSRARVSVGGVLMSFVLAMVIGVTGVIAPGGVAALGASTTLTIIGGDVQVSRQGAPFEAATDGAVLSPGDIIRTAADARAVLTYFEGSTVSIEPSTELAIDEASAAPDGSTVVVMTQNLGRTWHVVTKVISGGSKYEVRTPAATASVRGTAFEVGVVRQASGATTTAIITTEGTVAAAAPATAADPEPEPVVVPAGFQTSLSSTERKPSVPTLAPEPERRVTVSVSDTNSVVVDPLGRANGYRDGKLVLQTPGAQVVRADGKLTVTLPNVPDGKLSTVVGQPTGANINAGASPAAPADVQVTTTVEERGKAPATVTEIVDPVQEQTTGVEVKSGAGADATPNVRPVTGAEKKELKPPKTVTEPEKIEAPATIFRPGLGAEPRVIQKIVEERKAAIVERPSVPAVVSERANAPQAAIAPQTATAQQAPTAPAQAKTEDAGFVPQLSFLGAPSGASPQRAEAKKDEQRTEEVRKSDVETAIKVNEQLQKAAQVAEKVAGAAESKAGEEARRAEEAKARAEQAARDAEAARAKAERERRAAEEQAARAANDTARRAAEAEAQRQAEEQQRAEETRRAAEADRRRAEAEALEQARQQEKARHAEQASRELRERLEKELQKLQRPQSP